MRYARVLLPTGPAWARLDGSTVVILTSAPYNGGVPCGEAFLPSVRLLAPCEPMKIIGVGLNYENHRDDRESSDRLLASVVSGTLRAQSNPLLFLKPPTSVIGPGDAIVLPPESQRVDYEAELAVVVGRRLWRPRREEAQDAIFGYTCANDVTARDLQQLDVQWTRAKAFDTFCPVGPWIETDLDPAQVMVRGRLNGETRQEAPAKAMLADVVELVRFSAAVMTLLPGDVLLTGTPAGTAELQRGDVYVVQIDGVGELENPVV